ncbi:Tetratricopeptide repeat-containing protein [[Eubacterium] yurii]|jgi:hypothetical protein|nr:Tetratricopeptide repeat-containing protein [[Eubacterium] yurii]
MTEAENLVATAHSLWRAGKENDMLKYLSDAIKIYRSENNYPKLIEILNEYAGALRINGKYEEALKNIQEALSIQKSKYGINNTSYATTLMNEANIYREKGDYCTAEDIMLKSKKIFDALNDKSYSYVGLLNNLSLVYQAIKKYEKAEELQLEAIDILKQSSNYNVPLAISYNNLYSIQKQLNKFESAFENLLLAKNLLEKEVGKNHPLYSAVLNNLAEVKLKEKDYLSALELYKEALEVVEKCYGAQSSAYKSVQSNLSYVFDLISTLEIDDNSNRKYERGLDRAEKLAEKIKKLIYTEMPYIRDRICIALAGRGSECLGFDDEISSDHDNQTRCLLLLDDSDFELYFSQISDLIHKHISEEVTIQKITDFYSFYTSFPYGPVTIEDYRNIPEEYLCSATNGKVFIDNLGKFTTIRNRILNYYPQDFIYKKLAYHLNNISQSGQYNYPRLLKRKDIVAMNFALNEFVKHYIRVVHILNKKYTPFYKWSFRNLENLDILGDYTMQSLNLLFDYDDIEREEIINDMCIRLVQELNSRNITKSKIDFLTYQAYEITQKISDINLRNEDNWII